MKNQLIIGNTVLTYSHIWVSISFCLSLSLSLSAQSVGVGTATPNPSAILDVSSTAKGMLVPRMTTAQRTAILSPATGLLVFDTNTNSFWFKGGTTWVELIDSTNNLVHSNGSDIYMAMTGEVGVGNSNPANKLDVQDGTRTGTHPIGLPFYATGNILAASNGVEIRHNNATQGIGIGYNTIYAAGTDTDQSLGLQAKGTIGVVFMKTNGVERMRISGSGNVGIGTSTPNASLQFANTIQNRKIVLYESVNNDHQFYGLGINGGALRYQVPGTSDRHEFWAGTSASASNEIMRIVGNGRVGIGITNPLATLEIARGAASEGTLKVNGTTYPTHFNYSTAEHTFIRGGKNDSHIILNDISGLGNVGIGTDAPTNKLSVVGNTGVNGNLYLTGNQGITGTLSIGNGASTNAPLQFSNDVLSRKIVLYEDFFYDYHYYGFGINAGALRYQVPSVNDSHVFYCGTIAPLGSKELMRINGNGNVDVTGNVNVTQNVNVTGNLDVTGYVAMGFQIVENSVQNVPPQTGYQILCDCPVGTAVIGGGFDGPTWVYFHHSRPYSSTQWSVSGWNNSSSSNANLKVWAICARIGN